MSVHDTSHEPSGSSDTEMPTPGDEIDRARLKASLTSKLFGAAPEAVRIGRFRVLDRIGEGGMGIVYAAYDDQLDRKVAVKVLHAQLSDGAAKDRLLREAQALARLSHPNVVTVHEVGEHEGRVFVAMEFVRGLTLRAWQSEKKRSVGEILDAYTQAARGLAAAHAAGLVHRDFKPENVILARDGRVRVLDFGLARPGGSETDAKPLLETELPARKPGPLDSPLTMTGAVMGTPAYMAPEQHLGQTADARTDQFSFCVALYEALYGERPFHGETRAELQGAVTRGEVRETRNAAAVPSRMRRHLLRGLSPKSADRFASMDELVTALGHDPTIKRRKWLLSVAGLAIVGAVSTAGFVRSQPVESATCPTTDQLLEGVWDDERKQAVKDAMLATELPHAASTWERLEERVTARADAWANAMNETCAALEGLAPGESNPLLSARRTCLETQRADLEVLVDVFTTADSGMVDFAPDAVAQLPRLDTCTGPEPGQGSRPVPDDPALARTQRDIHGKLLRGLMELRVGQPELAIEHYDQALAEARAANLPALEAEALLAPLEVCVIHGPVGRVDCTDLRPTVKEAYVKALESGHTSAAANAATWMVLEAANRGGSIEDAKEWMQIADALVGRTSDALLRTNLHNARGALAIVARDYDSALTHFERAHQASHAEGRREIARGSLNNARFTADSWIHDPARRLEIYGRYTDYILAEYPPEHPLRIRESNFISAVEVGRLPAPEAIERARAIALDPALPMDEISRLVDTLDALELREPAQAMVDAALERTDGRQDADRLKALQTAGLIAANSDRWDEAVRHFEQARTLASALNEGLEAPVHVVPEWPLVLVYAGREGEVGPAIDELSAQRDALVQAGADTGWYNWLCDPLVRVGRLKQALPLCEQFYAVSPQVWGTRIGAYLGAALLGTDDERAIPLLRAAASELEGDTRVSFRDAREFAVETLQSHGIPLVEPESGN